MLSLSLAGQTAVLSYSISFRLKNESRQNDFRSFLFRAFHASDSNPQIVSDAYHKEEDFYSQIR